ncbi:hypothetical protein V8D89_012076 [Ganoderma adspersum]
MDFIKGSAVALTSLDHRPPPPHDHDDYRPTTIIRPSLTLEFLPRPTSHLDHHLALTAVLTQCSTAFPSLAPIVCVHSFRPLAPDGEDILTDSIVIATAAVRKLVLPPTLDTDFLLVDFRKKLQVIRQEACKACKDANLDRRKGDSPCSWETDAREQGLGDIPLSRTAHVSERINYRGQLATKTTGHGKRTGGPLHTRNQEVPAVGPASRKIAAREQGPSVTRPFGMAPAHPTKKRVRQLATKTTVQWSGNRPVYYRANQSTSNAGPANKRRRVSLTVTDEAVPQTNSSETVDDLTKDMLDIEEALGSVNDVDRDVETVHLSIKNLDAEVEDIKEQLETVSNNVETITAELKHVNDQIDNMNEVVGNVDAQLEQEQESRTMRLEEETMHYNALNSKLENLIAHMDAPDASGNRSE